MFSGMKWYKWFLIAIVFLIALPYKIRFIKWWSGREREKKNE